MTDDDNVHPTLHRQPMGVNGLPDDYIDDSDRDGAVGGSRDAREPQPDSVDDLGPGLADTAAPEDDGASRTDSVVKPAHGG
jgi:hypothetical protein